jgi:hypothetical protein
MLLYGPFPRGGLARGVSDATLLMSGDPGVRALALARIRATGATVVRIPVDWRYTVGEGETAAAGGLPGGAGGFDARDPGSPRYRFAPIDAAVRDTVAAGLTPLLVVSRAPSFAEAPGRWPYAYPGSWAPSPTALGEFAVALARRYDGSFPDPQAPARALPRVALFQAWNEPNLARYLEPQWVVERGRWQAFSPLLYRQLLNAFYAGVKSVQPRSEVLAAGIAPNGDPAGVGRMTPVRFLRALLCLEGAGPSGPPRSGQRRGHGRGLTGLRAGCLDPPHFDALAFHPLSFESPNTPAASAQDVAIADIAKVTGLLKQAERLRTVLPGGPKPIWATELNWESAPQSAHGVPDRLQAAWVSRALHRLWVAGVGLAEWQFLIDPYPNLLLATPNGGTVEIARPAGLYSAGVVGGRSEPVSARPKPFLRGFTLPFDPLRVNRGRVRVWGLLMRPGQRVLLQHWTRTRVSRRGAWRPVVRLRADRHGVLNVLVRLRGAADLRLVSGTLSSAAASVPRGRSRL